MRSTHQPTTRRRKRKRTVSVDALAGSRRSESGWEKGRRAPIVRQRLALRPLPRAPAPLEWPQEADTLASIKLDRVSRSFSTADGGRLLALEDVAFNVGDGEVVAIVGPNGSGKSTLLRLIAGLLAPDSGAIAIGDNHVTDADPRVGLVFQEPRLLPWRSTLDNVAFPLELAGVAAPARRERASSLLEMVGLTEFAIAYPRQLSGGMRQRAAIARALAREPSVLLLDEPFSALDALTRERFDAELLGVWQRTGTTVVLVTHSISEAVFVADRVLVLSPRPGRVIADIPVALLRPRTADSLDSVLYSRTASAIRAHLAGTADDHATDEERAAPVRDVLDRVGTPAWFDPFGGGG